MKKRKQGKKKKVIWLQLLLILPPLIIILIAFVVKVTVYSIERDQKEAIFTYLQCCNCAESLGQVTFQSIFLYKNHFNKEADQLPTIEELKEKSVDLFSICGDFEHSVVTAGSLNEITITVTLDKKCSCSRGYQYIHHVSVFEDDKDPYYGYKYEQHGYWLPSGRKSYIPN